MLRYVGFMVLYVCAVIGILFGIHAAAAAEVPLPKSRTANIVTAAKARLNARTIWPALSQREVDDITARAKAMGKSSVNIFCFNDEKCGELALSLENAFESARWTVAVRFSAQMIAPGLQASPKVIKTLATIDPGFGLSEDPEPEAIESITIGEKLQGRLE